MAKRKRPSMQAREREARKRERARKKREKAALKRERRDQKRDEANTPSPLIAQDDNLSSDSATDTDNT